MITLQPPRGGSGLADDWLAWSLSKAGLTRFTRRAVVAIGLAVEPDVLLTGDQAIRRLNREFRGKNKATDVLSFPALPEFAAVHGGDLAISLETAERQAAEHGHPLATEVRVLLLHGMLHLHGMDHETDTGEMAAREAELRRELRLPAGLIARVTATAGALGKSGSGFPAGMTAKTTKTTTAAERIARVTKRVRR